MEELTQRIARAKRDDAELERMVADYLPFIKKEVGKTGAQALEYDDRISLGMLVFMGCVRQYEEQRGAFLSYASTCIRNRLVDEVRKQDKAGTVSFTLDEEAESGATLDARVSLAAYDKKQEQLGLQEEIGLLSDQLAAYGISFGDLARICPRQKRSRALCADLARQVLDEEEMRAGFQQSGRLPQRELARKAGVSEKTVEKYRRYIVALLVIYQGDYPGIGAYIPGYREVD